jgi:hypothetical protein
MSKIVLNQSNMTGGGSILSMFALILYIIIKYPVKYVILFKLLMFMIFLMKKVYEFSCKAIEKFISFFQTILDPGTLNLIILEVPNIFAIFMAFIDLFIGMIYAFVAMIFFILLGLVSLPFNLIFSI